MDQLTFVFLVISGIGLVQGLQLSKDLTGVDLAALLSRLGGASAAAASEDGSGNGSVREGSSRLPKRIPVDGEPS